ncbi:hypothetical protein I8F73_01265 [Enterococcus faecalis]|nr:hypothetical protein [Enterococcus faecalis]
MIVCGWRFCTIYAINLSEETEECPMVGTLRGIISPWAKQNLKAGIRLIPK